jgi:hypothetical protein
LPFLLSEGQEGEKRDLSTAGLAPGDVQGVGEKTIPTILANQIDLPQVHIGLKTRFIPELHFLDQPLHPDLQISLLLRQVPIEIGVDLKIHDIFQASLRKIPAAANAK